MEINKENTSENIQNSEPTANPVKETQPDPPSKEVDSDSDSSEEEKMDENEKALWDKIEKVMI